jgi:hypothetical protein
MTMADKMEEMFSRGWNELIARDSGPLHFRLVLQPLVAAILAIRAGRRDAGHGRGLFFWTFVREPSLRSQLLRELCQDVGKLFLVAATLDVIYQVIVLRWFYPAQTVIVVIIVALIPYVVVRGLSNRIATQVHPRPPRD